MTTTLSSSASDSERALHEIATGIAGNLTSSRKQDAAEAPEREQPDPAPSPEANVAEQHAEPAAQSEREQEPESRDAGQQGADEGSPETDDEQSTTAPDSYTIADFATAAGVSGEEFATRMLVDVKQPDGSVIQVPLDELRNGYRWNAANTQKAQELAEQRKLLAQQFDAVGETTNRAEAIIKAQYASLDQAEEALKKQVDAVDWDELRQRGDGSFADARAVIEQQYGEIQRRREELNQAQQAVTDSRTRSQEQQMAEMLPRAREQMFELVPEWRDPDTMQREGAAMGEYAITQGFTAEEFASCIDPRVLRLLRQAWKGSQLSDRGAKAREVVAQAPRIQVKSGRRRTSNEVRAAEREKAGRRVAETGKATDYAALVLQRLRAERG